MEQIVLEVKKREETGRRSSKQLRYEGWIPAIIYSEGRDAMPLKIDKRALLSKVSPSRAENVLFNIVIDGQTSPAIVREIQIDPITDEVLHIDFYKVTKGKKLTISVPVVLLNRESCVGVKAGGVLEEHLREVEVECIPSKIPSAIEVDIQNLDIGDAIHVKDIQPPEGVEILQDPEDVVVIIEEPVKGLETVEEEAAAGAEEAVEEKETEE